MSKRRILEGYTTPEAITDAAERLRVLEAALGRDLLALRLPPPQARDMRAVALPTDPAQQTSHPGSPRSHAADPQYDLGQRQARQQQQSVIPGRFWPASAANGAVRDCGRCR